MLIASNLGQILGRALLNRTLEQEPAAGAAAKPKRRTNADLVLELLGRRGVAGCGEVAEALGITSEHAAVLLYQMRNRGLVTRSGERFSYRYRLP